MLETIREFALEKLAESGEMADVRRRHVEYFLALAQSANLTIEAEGEIRHHLVIRDWDNVRSALEWARDAGDVELGLQLVVALENYWVTNRPLEGQRWVGELLDRSGELPGEVGQPERSGRLWGALEAEEARAPVGRWEKERNTCAERVLAHVGPDFERGRQEGARFSLNEAVDEALGAVR